MNGQKKRLVLVNNKNVKKSNNCFNLINPIVTILAKQRRVKWPFRVGQESRQCLATLLRNAARPGLKVKPMLGLLK